MATFGSTLKQGLDVRYNISYNGAAQTWGTERMINVSSGRYEGESGDSKLNVPTFRADIYDADGSIWTTLGDGTTAFNKDLVVTVDVGGTYDWVEGHLGTHFKRTSSVGADTFTLHTGKVSRVGKRDKLVRLESRNHMQNITNLKWQFPINDTPSTLTTTSGGTRSTINTIPANSRLSVATTIEASIATYTGKAHAYVNAGAVTLANFVGTGRWDTARVSLGTYSGYSFRDTNFHTTHELIEFDFTEDGDGTHLDWPEEADPDMTRFYFLQKDLTVSGDPSNLARHFISGICVTDFFHDTNDIDANSFATSFKNYTYNNFYGTLPVEKKHGASAYDDVQDIVRTTSALLYVDPSNNINLKTYGPRNMQDTPDELTGTDFNAVGITNDIEDDYNRVTVKYAYSYTDDEFTRTKDIKSADWTSADDRTYLVESKWMRSRVEADIIAQRLFSRYKNTTPRVEFKTNLRQLGRGLGDVVRVTDADSGMSTKLVQINGFNADVIDSKEVSFKGLDGDSLWLQAGYALWEDVGETPTAVDDTHTSGWADATPNVTGINNALYGSVFVWW